MYMADMKDDSICDGHKTCVIEYVLVFGNPLVNKDQSHGLCRHSEAPIITPPDQIALTCSSAWPAARLWSWDTIIDILKEHFMEASMS